MGLTVTCARCHDHKFDPIATKDYYQMAAIFASTLSYERGEEGDPVQTPLAPPSEFESFSSQWTAYNDLEDKVSKIIDFDKDAKQDRDAAAEHIAEFMLAAYRVYGEAETFASVPLRPSSIRNNFHGGWNISENPTAPELARWHAATDPIEKTSPLNTRKNSAKALISMIRT